MTTPFQFTQTSLFSPTQISGCQLWLDGADPNGDSSIPANGSAISTWVDKSGSGKSATQTNPSFRPTYSSSTKSIAFRSASSQHLIGSSLLTSTSYSIFYVNNTLSPANIQFVFFDYKKGTGGTGQNFIQCVYNASNYEAAIVYSESPVTTKIMSVLPASTTTLITSIVDSATNISQNFFISGTQQTTTFTNGGIANLATDAFGYTLGTLRLSGAASTTNTLNGDMFEVIVYLTELTTVQREQVEGYLAWKWGLQGSLPANHPYKSTPVYAAAPFPLVPQVKTFTNTSNFLPTQISGCSLWYDASDLSTVTRSGSSVTSWRSKGSSTTSVTNATNYPSYVSNRYNGLGTVRFTFAINQALSNASVSSSIPQTNANHAIFLVHNPNANNSTPFGFLDTTGTLAKRLSVVTPEGSNISYDVGNSRLNYLYPSQGTYLNGNLRLETFYVANTNRFYRRDGSELASNTITTFSYDATQILYLGGAQPSYPGYSYGGDYCEIVWFNLPLTITQIQQVEGYLAWKWGTQIYLPSTHPYKSTPVYAAPPFPLVPQVKTFTNVLFNPRSITGCQLWLDGADPNGNGNLPANGTVLSLWKDKSVNGFDATGFNSPIFSQKSITMNGTSQYFTSSATINSATHTLIGVHRPTNTTSANTSLIRFQTTGPLYVVFPYYNGASGNRGYITSFGTSAINFQNSTLFDNSLSTANNIIIATIESGSQVVYRNGTSQASTSVPLSSSTTPSLFIGAFALGPSEFYSGTISEILVYTTFLTTSQRQQVEGYLAWKWGLQGSLPSNHPFKLFPPSP